MLGSGGGRLFFFSLLGFEEGGFSWARECDFLSPEIFFFFFFVLARGAGFFLVDAG